MHALLHSQNVLKFDVRKTFSKSQFDFPKHSSTMILDKWHVKQKLEHNYRFQRNKACYYLRLHTIIY